MENLEDTAPEQPEIIPDPAFSAEITKLYTELSKLQGDIDAPANNCYNEHPGRSPELSKLYTALSKFQGEIEEPENNCYNDHLHYWYPDLGACWKAIRSALSTNGLALIQFTIPNNDPYVIRLVTKICHTSGQWESGVIDGRAQELIPLVENGEVVTEKKGNYDKVIKVAADSHSNSARSVLIGYLKRLALCMVTGLSTDDTPPENAEEIIRQKKDTQPAGGGQRRQSGGQNKKTGNGHRPGSNRESQIAGIKKAMELAELNSETLIKLFNQYGVANVDELPDQELSAFSKGIISAKRFQEKTMAAEKEQAEGVPS